MSCFSSVKTAWAIRSMSFRYALLATLFLVGPLPAAQAAITPTGDVIPDPSTWDFSTTGYVGQTGDGTLTVDGASCLLSENGYIGYGSAATGLVSVSGPCSTWGNYSLFVGNSGSGTLSITNGGYVVSPYVCIACNPGSTGLLKVDSAGLALYNNYLYVGNSGSGMLSITNGGLVISSDACIGCYSGSSGTVTVDGSGSRWTTGPLYVGGGDSSYYYGGGSGTLSVTNGGNVSSWNACIGYADGSTGAATVDGAGSNLTNSGSLYVGYSGGGTLSVSNGGNVSTYNGYIGNSLGSTGAVTVDGPGSTWTNNGSLLVGCYGNGSLSITARGVVNSYGGGNIGCYSGSSGSVAVDGLGSTWTNYYGVTVGYNGSGSLSITNGATVSNTWGNCYIGYTTGSWGAVTVDGPGSNWTNNGGSALCVGYSGNGMLSISNGGAVSNSGGYIGAYNGSSGTVTVDGTGSSWTNAGPLYVGGGDYSCYYGSGNGTLSITNGGAVSSVGGYIGYGTASSGAVTVDGPGSIWTNSGSLYLGGDNNYGGAGTLSITNGGTVSVTAQTYVGWLDGSTGAIQFGASGGTLTTQGVFVSPSQLSGAGTINARGLVSDINLAFDSSHPLNQSIAVIDSSGDTVTVNLDMSGASGPVGDLGAGYLGGGSLTIRDGIVVNSNNGYVGFHAGSTGTAVVDGAGSAWNNNNNLCVGYSGSGSLAITNRGYVYSNYGYVGFNNGSTGMVTVDGIGSNWNNSTYQTYQVCVGYSGSGTMSITNGGNATGYYGYVGYNDGSRGLVTVDGAGSTWSASYGFYVGGCYSGAAGTLSITNGGTVFSNGYYWCSNYIGNNTGTTGLVTVDGAGSAWNCGYYLYVGYYGDGTLAITNGGSVSSGTSYIGYVSGAAGSVSVDGANSTWTNAGDLYVGGYSGGIGTLSITNGGSVSVAGTTYVGWNGCSGAICFGTNGGTLATKSLWVSPDQLAGTGTINTCGLVSDIALVFDATHPPKQTIPFDYFPGQSITLNLDMSGGPGVNGVVGAGYRGNGSLAIRDGVTLNSAAGYLGYCPSATGAATVDGAGTTWANDNELDVGYSGIGTLAISNCATVSNTTGYVGYNSGSTGRVTVDGLGSSWNSNYLYIGYSGNGTLNITNGGNVTNAYGYIGSYGGATGLVTVDGPNSTWTNTGDLYVGLYSGGSATLSITNGGGVSNITGYIGYAGSGAVTVDGAGSTWANSGAVYVGGGYYWSGGSGILSITNGGGVTSTGGYVGDGYYQIGSVTVDGAGSKWTNRGSLYVGGDSYYYVSGTGTLNITNGGTVINTIAYIGYASNALAYVNISGAGSTWLNRGNLYVGYGGTGTVTQIGGTNTVAGILCFGQDTASSGTYNLNGGVLGLHGLAAGSGTAAFNFGGGALRADASFASALPITLTGIGGNATVNTSGHAVSLSGTLSGAGGLTKTGSGTLTLSATNNYNGLTTVAGGVLDLVGNSIGTPGAWNPVLNLAGVDIQAGKIVFDYAGGTDPAATIESLLTTSYDGGRWDRGEFRCSTAAANGLTLGWIDNTVSQQVIVMATIPGDFNLDGIVDSRDRSIWASHVFTGTTWAEGDANYDGAVNGLDRDILVANNLRSVGNSPFAVPAPEPATISLLAAALLGLLAYARKRRA